MTLYKIFIPRVVYDIGYISYLLHDETPVYSPLKSTLMEIFENLKTKNRNVQKCYAVIIDN